MNLVDGLRGIAFAIDTDAGPVPVAELGYTVGYFLTILALAWRASWTLPPFALTLICALFLDQQVGLLAMIAILLALAAYAVSTIPLAAMVVAALGWEYAWRVLHDAVDGRLLWPLPIVLLLVLPGLAIRAIVRRVLQDRAQAAVREEAARQREQELVAENRRQRRAVSRELHDVVAHELTRIAMHSSMAQLGDEPAEHRQALQAISASARSAMTELRRVVRLLDTDAGQQLRSPGEGVGSLELQQELERTVAYLSDLGRRPQWRLEGDPAQVPPGLLPTAVAVLRETATNVVKHSSGEVRCLMTVSIGEELAIEVRSELSDGVLDLPESGIGLAGLRGRVTELGGSFDAGANGGWWVVRAVLPLSSASPPQPPEN